MTVRQAAGKKMMGKTSQAKSTVGVAKKAVKLEAWEGVAYSQREIRPCTASFSLSRRARARRDLDR